MTETAGRDERLEILARRVDAGLEKEEQGWRETCEALWQIRQEFVGEQRPINASRAKNWIVYAAGRFSNMGERSIKDRAQAWETVGNLADAAVSASDKAEVIELVEKLPQKSLRGLGEQSRKEPEKVWQALQDAVEKHDEPTAEQVKHFVAKHLPDLNRTHLRMPIRRALDLINDFELTPRDYVKELADDPVTRDKIKAGIEHAIRYLQEVRDLLK